MNLSNSFQIGLLTIVSIVLLSACKKKDEVRPELSVNKPITNTQYYATVDYILCTGTASDDIELDRIEFQLRTTLGKPALGKKIVFPDSNPYNYSYGYFLDDIHLENGTYKMKIEAFDKAGNSNAIYKEVIIYGVPRGKQGVFYISESSGSFSLGRIDSLDVDSTVLAVFNDFGGFEINNYDQKMYFMGYDTEDLIAYNTRTYTESWRLDNQSNPPNTYYFNQLNFSSDRYLSISLYQDQVKNLLYNGGGAGAINLNYQNAQAELIYKDGIYAYVESRSITGGNRLFQRYFFSSGAFDEQYSIDYDFREMFSKGSDELIIFGENGGQALFKIFYKNGGGYFQPIILNSGSFVDAFKINDDNYLIVQSQGVYLYTYSNTNLITKISEANILSADYDVLNDQIYLGFANLVKVYTSGGTFLRNIPTSGNIINLKVHYNK